MWRLLPGLLWKRQRLHQWLLSVCLPPGGEQVNCTIHWRLPESFTSSPNESPLQFQFLLRFSRRRFPLHFLSDRIWRQTLWEVSLYACWCHMTHPLWCHGALLPAGALLVTMVTPPRQAGSVCHAAAVGGAPSIRCVMTSQDAASASLGSEVGHVTSVRSATPCSKSSVCVSNCPQHTHSHTQVSAPWGTSCVSSHQRVTMAAAPFSLTTWTALTTTSCLSTWALSPWRRTSSWCCWRTGPKTSR